MGSSYRSSSRTHYTGGFLTGSVRDEVAETGLTGNDDTVFYTYTPTARVKITQILVAATGGLVGNCEVVMDIDRSTTRNETAERREAVVVDTATFDDELIMEVGDSFTLKFVSDDVGFTAATGVSVDFEATTDVVRSTA